jgi:hypothetical protein
MTAPPRRTLASGLALMLYCPPSATACSHVACAAASFGAEYCEHRSPGVPAGAGGIARTGGGGRLGAAPGVCIGSVWDRSLRRWPDTHPGAEEVVLRGVGGTCYALSRISVSSRTGSSCDWWSRWWWGWWWCRWRWRRGRCDRRWGRQRCGRHGGLLRRPGGLRSRRRALGALTALATGQLAQCDGGGPTFARIRRCGQEQRGEHEQRDGSQRHDGGRCGVNCFLHFLVPVVVKEALGRADVLLALCGRRARAALTGRVRRMPWRILGRSVEEFLPRWALPGCAPSPGSMLLSHRGNHECLHELTVLVSWMTRCCGWPCR